MTARTGRGGAALATLLLLGGCGGELGLALAGASAVSFATTDKFLSDHAVSAVTGEDCSALQFEQTGEFCRAAEDVAAERLVEAERRLAATPGMYCYRTLGDITCYEEQDYQASLAQQVR
ncbi:MAG: hypothetical protein BroJett029_14000 [Alphaproteobacteria bacterium]|nr:MAG: hypothetical protein BroJett029_14000 [Alphaproteobacteria bacterium]